MDQAEKIIENLNNTVIEITKIMKDLIMLNETLEQENQELVQSLLHYEHQTYKLKKLILALDPDSDKENKY
jgi:hypothetical protein